MRNAFFFAVLILGGALGVLCQELPPSISTSTIDSARFEIIQSHDRGTTFRLDRFMGVVHRLGNCPKDDNIGSEKCWKEMIVVDLNKAGGAVGKPRFQIIINNSLKMTMLMQVETGQTWQYGIEPTDKWYPFIECHDRTSSVCLWRP